MTGREDPDLLANLRAPNAEHGGVFRHGDGRLMVFDADAASRANAENFADLTLPDRFVDRIRGRRSPAVSWRQVRSLWLSRLRVYGEESRLRALADRMAAVLDGRLDRHVDLAWLSHEVMFRSLLPVVVDGLSTSDRAWLERDAIAKLTRLDARPGGRTRRQEWQAVVAQLHTGRVVRKEIRRRARGGRARDDLTQPVVDRLLPSLGPDRALEAVTTVLTAIAGPPGAVAGCLMYELAKRPEWAATLAEEFATGSAEQLYRTGTRSAPTAHRFVKEVLRMWSAPLLMTRSARVPLTVRGHRLAVGRHYLVSPYLVNHDERHWSDPEVFDPHRWSDEAARRPPGGHYYVPFGWAPTTCVGAGLGSAQLVLLAHLLCTRYRLELRAPDDARVALGAVPRPLDFDGWVRRRDPSGAGAP
ncbi:cytochrome P450 [Saccharothrix algeriensis]|uniref:Cytochrome P450 n=1 Tax=Saccharothrix algeriensis TaxID=173560 RepID=A0A8T8I0W0_9PSEU|nr:cytochrome P450 [Saccharothrix algeriensis]MBM7810088.1 cytochrome P450 [Saccharothrix algeriensis]QTR04301.1 cytochrome P450 [Saccharothrix algeriensis]